MFYKMNKSKNFTPGFIMVLHTFGRDLKWNPHIHCLLSAGGYSDDGFWRHVKHFNYTYLRNAFRTALLNEMESKIGPSFKKVKADCYTEHKHGFYAVSYTHLSLTFPPETAMLLPLLTLIFSICPPLTVSSDC